MTRPTTVQPVAFARRHSSRAGLAILALLLAGAGCVREVLPPTQTIWETTLSGSFDHPGVTGSAASISSGGATEIGIQVNGLPPGQTAWGVFRGSCEEPGEILGAVEAYPALEENIDGGASASAILGVPMLESRAYFAQVVSGEGTQLACGNFVLWN